MKIKVKLLKGIYPYQAWEECMIDEKLVYWEFKEKVQVIETAKVENFIEKVETKDKPKKAKSKSLKSE